MIEVNIIFFKEMTTFIQQGHFKLIQIFPFMKESENAENSKEKLFYFKHIVVM